MADSTWLWWPWSVPVCVCVVVHLPVLSDGLSVFLGSSHPLYCSPPPRSPSSCYRKEANATRKTHHLHLQILHWVSAGAQETLGCLPPPSSAFITSYNPSRPRGVGATFHFHYFIASCPHQQAGGLGMMGRKGIFLRQWENSLARSPDTGS